MLVTSAAVDISPDGVLSSSPACVDISPDGVLFSSPACAGIAYASKPQT